MGEKLLKGVYPYVVVYFIILCIGVCLSGID
jgi:hypothetical protein